MHNAACNNRLRIMGSREDLQKFKEWASTPDSPISLAKAIPVPEELLKLDPNLITPSILEKYGAIDPMTWKDDNWGTYKDFQDVKIEKEIEFDEEETQLLSQSLQAKAIPGLTCPEMIVGYTYKTTCIPPLHAYRVFSEKFPNIMFHASFDVEADDQHKHDTSGFLLVKAGKMLKRWFNPISFNTMRIHMGMSGGGIDSEEFNVLITDNDKLKGEEDND